MRRIRYQVACSLDGYIAGPNDEYDWIVDTPDFDFEALNNQFDTLLMGRRTYEVISADAFDTQGHRVVVCSRTMRQEDHPDLTIISDDIERHVKELREEAGKDIWLFGGGVLLRTLLEFGCVDTVEPAIVPVLLGGGIPFLATPALRQSLRLTGHHVYSGGMVLLEYAVQDARSADKERKAARADSSG